MKKGSSGSKGGLLRNPQYGFSKNRVPFCVLEKKSTTEEHCSKELRSARHWEFVLMWEGRCLFQQGKLCIELLSMQPAWYCILVLSEGTGMNLILPSSNMFLADLLHLVFWKRNLNKQFNCSIELFVKQNHFNNTQKIKKYSILNVCILQFFAENCIFLEEISSKQRV